MKNQKDMKSIISLVVVLSVAAVGTAAFVNYSIEDSISRKRAVMISLIDSTGTETEKDLSVEQWKTAGRSDKLQTAMNFLLETSWQNTELDEAALRHLNYNRSLLVTIAGIHLMENPGISKDTKIKSVFGQIRGVEALGPEFYKKEFESNKQRLEDKS